MRSLAIKHTVNNNKIILFDAICVLCNGWCRFIIQHDNHKLFKLASVQSEQGQELLQYFNMPTDYFNTMVYIEAGQAYVKSDAFFRIMSQLNWPWKALTLLHYIPASIRDWFYDRIALNRYQLFGQYSHCQLPTADHKSRFLRHE